MAINNPLMDNERDVVDATQEILIKVDTGDRPGFRRFFQLRALGKHTDDTAFSLFGYSKAVIAFGEVARIE
jgi:hypothetical protein